MKMLESVPINPEIEKYAQKGYLGSNGRCYGSIAEIEKDTGVKMKYYSYVNFPMERVPEQLFLSITHITTCQFDSRLPDRDGIKLSVVNQFGEKPNTTGIKDLYVYVNRSCVQVGIFHLQNNSTVFKDITLYTNWGKKFQDGDKIHIEYDLADGTKMCTGIANYITPQHYTYTIPNTSGYFVPSHNVAGQSGCFTTNPANSSGGIYWDSSCGKPWHQQGYSHSIVKEATLPAGPQKCTCPMLTLMREGCLCGGC